MRMVQAHRCTATCCLARSRQCQREGRTLAQSALDPQLASHGTGQVAADRESKPRALVRRVQLSVDLDKWREDEPKKCDCD